MRRVLAAVAAFLMALVGAVVVAAPAHPLAKIKCDAPHGNELSNGADKAVFVGKVDPIVNHNQPESMHQHDFFGSFGWQEQLGNTANYDEVLALAATSCRDQGDTGSYWAPSLVYTEGPKAGERVKVLQFTAYYRAFAGQKFGEGRIFPRDTRLVAEDNDGYGIHGWNCGQNSQQAAEQGPVQFIPDCTGEDGTPGNTLTSHVNFPSCWDGVYPGDYRTGNEVGDTRDNAHYAYPVSKTACPASHPIKMIQLRETIQYDYQGDGTDVALVSDLMHGARPGTTYHVDFWNTWDQDALRQMARDCINDQSAYTVARCDP